MYIDFGAGYDTAVQKERMYRKMIPWDESIVGVDRALERPNDFVEFHQIMDEYYTRVDNMWIRNQKMPFRFYDCYIIADVRDDIDILEKADRWDCVSTLEHVPDEELDDFLNGLISKIKDDSVGHLHIDLTDHRYYPPDENSFLHYTDDTWGITQNKWNAGLFLNRIKRNEWLDILDQYFTFDFGKNDDQYSISLINVQLKTG